jgi:hypothetical protein
LNSTVSPIARLAALLPGLLLATAAAFSALAGLAPATGSASLNDKLVPSSGAFYGIFAGQRDGRTLSEEMPYLERKVGRTFDLDHFYYRWDDGFPSPHDYEAKAAGRIPVMSWAALTRSGTPVKWSAIANGSQDAMIRRRADAFKAFGAKSMLVFHHEPEDDLARFGSPSDYRAAWRRIVSIFRARGATNAVFVWTMMAYTFNPNGKNPDDYYPGNDVIDWVAADGYNWYGSNHVTNQPWRSSKEVFSSFQAWAKAKGKPGMIGETGSLEDPNNPQRKADWIREMGEVIKSWPHIKGFMYFQGQGWHFDSSTAATNAFKALGKDPWFNPRSPSSPPSSDVIDPSVRITSPTQGSFVASRSTVRITASASDDRSVDKVAFYVNGQSKCVDDVAPYTCDWKVWNDPGKTNWLKAIAYDEAGNSQAHTISVGTVPGL